MSDRTPSGVNRRELLQWTGVSAAAATAGLCLGACRRPDVRISPKHYEVRARLRGRVHRIRFERALRPGPLRQNDSLTLRRYAGHATTAAREAQLLSLAWTADAEDAFLHTLPDNVWTEIGAMTERGGNAASIHGVRIVPVEALLKLYSGKVPGIRRPRRIVNYHYHPLKFARRTLGLMGSDRKLERMIHLPSAGDFHLHAKLLGRLGALGAAVTSKVAVPDALIDYSVPHSFAMRLLAAKDLLTVQELRLYEQQRLYFARHDWDRDTFQRELTGALKRAGFAGDEFQLTIHRRGMIEGGEK
ncbi:MAG: hypothetical protein ABI333_15440 [bacterium]